MPPRAGTINVISPQQSPMLPGPMNAYVTNYAQQERFGFDDSGKEIAPIPTPALDYGPPPMRITRIWQYGLTMMSTARYVGFPRSNSYIRLSPPPITQPGRGLGGISMYAGKRSDNISRIPGAFVNWPSGS